MGQVENPLERFATPIAVVILTLLMALSAEVYHLQDVAGNTAKAQLVHTYKVTGHIQLLSNRLKDVELGQHNFIASGERQYLAPYYDAMKDSLGNDAKSDQMEQHHSIAEEFKILRELTADSIVQQQNLDELDHDIQDLKARWKLSIEHPNGISRSEDAQQAFGLMNQVRGIISIMMAEENHLLVRRIEADASSSRKGNQLTYLGVAIFYIVMVSAILLYQRSRQKADATRRQLIAKLTSSNTELERFAYVASHDMQEPLRMITNFSLLIGKEYGDKLDDEGNEYIHLVTESSKRMQSMVEDLLEYARVGNDAIRVAVVNGEEELQHVLDNLAASIREHDAIITHDKLPNVEGNAVQFMRLLQNLIGNAMKYQAEGSKPLIHITVEDKQSHWQYSVRDNGIGMQQEYANQIFEPFRRLHTWREFQGTGIGLAICKKIVESHGGTIWVNSQLAQGSVFHFTIPKLIQPAS